ncbi:hypothetical protein ACP4OV_021878 [Aristida adscensionis]
MTMAMGRASPANPNVLLAALLCAAVAAASFLPSSSSAADASFVSQTCRRTPHPRLCVSVLLQPTNRSSSAAAATTVGELAVAAMAAARKSTFHARFRATELSNDERNGAPPTAAAGDLVRRCEKLYGDCLRAATEALSIVSTASTTLYGRAADVAAIFHVFPDRCESVFAERRIASPLEQVNRDMQEKLAVASDIIRLLR